MVKRIIETHLTPSRDYIFGFADLHGIISKGFGDFKYGISIGEKLDNNIVDPVISGPTMEYFNHYKQINTELAQLTENISNDLNLNSIETLNISPSVSTKELDTIYAASLRTELPHKTVATHAGLGWIGKSGLLITKEFGPRLRLVTILVKTPLISNKKPVVKSRCGKCNICVDVCPAKAMNGKSWDISVDRDIFLNAQTCRDKCKEFGKTKLNMDARVCGICVAACPIGNR